MPYADPSKRREAVKRWKERNPEKERTSHNATRKLHHRRAENLRLKYGLSLEDYEAMLEKQGRVCAICLRPERRQYPKTGRISPLAVDHCHTSGRVRGLLCSTCNTAIGLLGDDPLRVARAIEYLKK